MIDLKKLSEDDIGRFVEYADIKALKREIGILKSWNDKFIFVVYKCEGNWEHYYNYTACATRPEDLIFLEGKINNVSKNVR